MAYELSVAMVAHCLVTSLDSTANSVQEKHFVVKYGSDIWLYLLSRSCLCNFPSLPRPPLIHVKSSLLGLGSATWAQLYKAGKHKKLLSTDKYCLEETVNGAQQIPRQT